MEYKWFDLEHNEQTELNIHTSVIMEGTLRDYNQVNANNALNTSLQLMSEVKKYGGEFISIFHNNFLGNDKQFKGWREMYDQFIMS